VEARFAQRRAAALRRITGDADKGDA
jgi:hypothetical protein